MSVFLIISYSMLLLFYLSVLTRYLLCQLIIPSLPRITQDQCIRIVFLCLVAILLISWTFLLFQSHHRSLSHSNAVFLFMIFSFYVFIEKVFPHNSPTYLAFDSLSTSSLTLSLPTVFQSFSLLLCSTLLFLCPWIPRKNNSKAANKLSKVNKKWNWNSPRCQLNIKSLGNQKS